MSEQRTVYVVTEGSYSDYHILAVFDDAERATTLARLVEDSRVELWPLNPPFGFNPHEHSGMALWRASHYRSSFGGDHDAWYVRQVNPLEHTVVRWTPDASGIGYGDIVMWARDKAHALKVAQDKRAEWLATQEGIA